MIEGYVGLPGSGKTYTLTARALDELKAGRRVFANYPIDGCESFGPGDLLDLPPGYIVLDEAHLWLSSRSFHKLPHSWLVKLSQTRKAGWHLLWSAQHPSRVDKALRDVTNVLWWCNAWPSSFTKEVRPRIVRCAAYEPHVAHQVNPRDPELALARKTRLFRMSVAEAYDSWEPIEAAEHLMQDDAYAPTKEAAKPSRPVTIEGF